ncbi:hypothetical protein LIER_38577 [Lithospermum erythrorhizon]|uniref:Filament-like plant protein 7 n=1 Tax=Lithospermum erythrorhizon TaxID=34254 RepID=A0AAV3Q2U4_LITER
MWKRKSLDKAAADKANASLTRNEEEIQTLLQDKADMEKELIIIREKLSSALSDCNAKAQIAQEAISGWEKMETQAIAMKQQLDKALQEKAASEERLVHLDAALKESLRQLYVAREDQGNQIHDAVMKTSRDYEGKTRTLGDKLSAASARLATLDYENTQLSKALLRKEKEIEEWKELKTRMETEVSALLTRLESTEKKNTSLIYEVSVLEKQLEIRNDEIEFNQRTADVSHKQYLESAKKITKLESECQRLRLLVRKRLPGPAAWAKMKSEVEILGKDLVDTRRKSNLSPIHSADFFTDMVPDTSSRKFDLLSHQLCQLGEENRSLKEALNKKGYDLQPFRVISAHVPSDRQVEEFQNGHMITDLGSTVPNGSLQEFSLTSMSDMGNDDKASCAESSASALITDLEHFKNGNQMGTPSPKSFRSSDINLMDDFVEIEKLAVGLTESPFSGSRPVTDYPNNNSRSGTNPLMSDVKQTVSQLGCKSDPSTSIQELKAVTTNINNHPLWLADIVKIISDQCHLTNRSVDYALEDIKVALMAKGSLDYKAFDDANSSEHPSSVYDLGSSRIMPEGSTDVKSDACDEDVSATERNSRQFQSTGYISLHKIIELIESINIPDGRNSDGMGYTNSETPTGYMVRVLQWKTNELSTILEQFVQSCRDLSMRKVHFEKFTEQLTGTLEWILNHCFSIQDVSSMKDEIKNNLDWDDAQSESEIESGTMNKISNSCKLHPRRVELQALPFLSGGGNHSLPVDKLQSTSREDESKLDDELSSSKLAKKDMERRLHSEVSRSESLMTEVQELMKTIESLQAEVSVLKQSNSLAENQIEKQKIANEELEEQLTAAKCELDEACEKFLSLEEELDYKTSSLEKLKVTALDLELQLRAKMEFSEDKVDNGEILLQKDREIEAASETLAECQETITNLGKQLKAMASPKDRSLFDKLSATTVHSPNVSTETESPLKVISQRSTPLEKLMAEDRSEIGNLMSQTDKGTDMHVDEAPDFPLTSVVTNEMPRSEEKTPTIGFNAIVPVKKRNGMWKKLIWRRHSSSKNFLVSC